jgi:hypothetical protein
MVRSCVSICFSYAFLTLVPYAAAAPIATGDTLQVVFTTDPITHPCPLGPCSLLQLFVGGPGAAGGSGQLFITQSLYDGTTLLGAGPAGALNDFLFSDKNTTSPGMPIEFGSILNGTINGVIDITWTGPGTLIGYDSSYLLLYLESFSPDGIFLDPSSVTILSTTLISSAVPEPSYSPILILFLAGALSKARGQSRRARLQHRAKAHDEIYQKLVPAIASRPTGGR